MRGIKVCYKRAKVHGKTLSTCLGDKPTVIKRKGTVGCPLLSETEEGKKGKGGDAGGMANKLRSA